MKGSRVGPEKMHQFEARALAFVVEGQGAWTPDMLQRFRASLIRRHLTPTERELDDALTQAQRRFAEGPAHFFLCAGRPCRQRMRFDSTEPACRRSGAGEKFPVTLTACQGPCKQAPVATLRVGQRCTMFAQFSQPADWHAVLDFAARAVHAGTLLVDPGPAQPFRFDPVHDHDKGRVLLQPLQFLLGHFHGNGQYTSKTGMFQKEMVGAWEAGGRFLSLRMGVTYPLADGRNDIHEALVIVGVNPNTRQLEGRAYTDGGGVHDYQLELHEGAVCFADRPPGHSAHTAQARKILRPTEDGFEERLEIDRGTGQFEPYSIIVMQRVADS